MNIKKMISVIAAALITVSTISIPAFALDGDINNNGNLDAEDSLYILRRSVGLEKFTQEQDTAADVDHDGNITSADALIVLRRSVGLDLEDDKMVKEKLTTLSLPYPGRSNKTVRVFVPEHEQGETLPVVYMTDGQNLFEDTTVQFGCWYTREAVRDEKAASGKAAIIVGIHNDGDPVERGNDLLPKCMGSLDFPADMPEQQKAVYDPHGEVFEDFVLNTVMPAVEEQFPVKKGRENTAFCGSSMGGLESYYIVMNNPDKFSAAGVLSPAFLMYKHDDLESWIRTKSAVEGTNPFVYLYVGGADPMEQELAPHMQFVYGVMQDCYPNNKIKNVEDAKSSHNEKAWEPVFRDFLHIFLTQGE